MNPIALAVSLKRSRIGPKLLNRRTNRPASRRPWCKASKTKGTVMTQLQEPDSLLRLVDGDTGLINRRIFSDRDIYDLELERIFARAWNFVAHESMIPNPGDFFMNYIGEDRVIVVRDNDGLPRVLVNSCRHRGNAVCRAEEGHATSFMCTYHGWTYDLKGNLVGYQASRRSTTKSSIVSTGA